MTTNKEKYSLYRPKKFLGQNFLVDENIAKKIVASLGINPGDPVLEIGPGQGVLTKYIHKLTDNFVAVELDKSIYEKLSAEYSGKARFIHKDFLKINLNDEAEELIKWKTRSVKAGKIKVIGNIPYNITTEILFKLYESADLIDSAVLMMQKEVAKRLTAQPYTKDYGILAIQTQIHTSPKILFSVPPTAFFPKPKVESAIVRFEFMNTKPGLTGISDVSDIDKTDITDKTDEIEYREGFRQLIKQSFSQRRKTMKNSLKDFFEKNNISPENIEFDFSRRAESVTISEYISLHNKINKLKNKTRSEMK